MATVARNAGVDSEAIEDMKVAVSETCSVAMAGQERTATDRPVELDLCVVGDRLEVEIRDWAPAATDGARPGGEHEADAAERQFGLALVAALVEELTASARPEGGNRTGFSMPRAGNPAT